MIARFSQFKCFSAAALKWLEVRGRLTVACFGILALLTACGGPPHARLEAVAPLPAPSKPAWIAEIAPVGTTPGAAQIRVIFRDAVLPAGELGTAAERKVLDHFQIAPAIAGSFIVLTPRMIGFEAAGPLPKATRGRVTLTAGLADLNGHKLDRDLAWTFETESIDMQTDEGRPDKPPTISLRPSIQVTSNTQLDAGSLTEHASFRTGSMETPVVVKERPEDKTWVYTVSAGNDLKKASDYALTIEPGVLPVNGNIPSQAPLRIALQTYSPLELLSASAAPDDLTSTGSARFAGGDPVLKFNNAIDPKTFAAHVTVRPSPRPVGQLVSLINDGATIAVNPYALNPLTTYRISADADLSDVYGQHLRAPAGGSIETSDLAPYFWAPSGYNVFIAGSNLQVQYSAVNLPDNRYTAAYRTLSPSDLVYVSEQSADTALPNPSNWTPYTIAAKRNAAATISVPLRARFGGLTGLLAYGAQASAGRYSPSFTGAVMQTNLAISAQWFPQSGSVMVQRLDDGAPVPGAAIDLYVSHLYDQAPKVTNPQPCASGRANAQGVLMLQGSALAACYAGNRPSDQAPELLAMARSGSDWSFVRTLAWSGAYDYTLGNLDSTWSNGQPISRGTIFSDRQMYQPGERAWLTAICYVLQNGTLKADRGAQYTIQLQDPDGRKHKLPARTANRYATFSFPVDFSKRQPLGYYTVTATSPDGAQMTGTFRVAEFRPPNFSVDLKLDREYAASGESVNAAGDARYLFGAPMKGANATLHVTRQPAYFTPKGWDDYVFGRQWFWPEEQPDISGEVATRTIALDTDGKGTSAIGVDRDLPYASTYRVDLEVTDASHLSTSATQSFTALPSPQLIGLHSDFVGTAGSAIPVSVIVTDAAGKAQSGVRVHLELQKMQYSGVTQIVEGAESARNQVNYATVAQIDVTSGTQPQTAVLTAKDSGSYRIRANFAGAASPAGATDTQVWITGPGNAAFGDQNPAQLQMRLDKQQYALGDTAVVGVASPYQRADLYLSVVRDRVLYQTLIHVNGSAPRVRIPIRSAMFPNAAVEAVLVRRGAPLSAKTLQSTGTLVRLGMLPLNLDIRLRYLKVNIVAAQPRIQPGGSQTVRLQLRDLRGAAVRGQFTVIVADDAVLRLSGYRPPDLVETVFAQQPISVRFADSRPNVTLSQPRDTMQKGWGYGGGFLAGAASTRVRTNFVPLAYFNGAVETDAGGNANVTFKVPDNLTTWRVMAVALTAAAAVRFGSSDSTFIATKALVTNPLLPQFARPGDRFDAGLSLFNGSTGSLDARTQGEASGALRFEGASSSLVQAQQSFAPGLNAWRFPMTLAGGGAAWLQFRTQAGASDAFRVPLTIRTTDVRENVIDSGATQTKANVPLQIGADHGSVTVAIAGSLLSQAAVPARIALERDRLTLLPELANRLSIAASVLKLQREFGTKFSGIDAAGEAAADVSSLAALQRMGGGFSFWPEQRASDALGSMDALRAFAAARSAGVTLPANIAQEAAAYAASVLADPSSAGCTDSQCALSVRLAALRALAANGDRRTDFLQQIFADRAKLSTPERAQLAVYLQQTPGWSPQAATSAAELMRRVYITGRYAAVQSGSSYESPAEAQAAYLELLVLRGAPATDRDRAVQALFQQSCRCGWPSSGDAAAALESLATAAKLETPANFDFNLTVNGKAASHGHVTAGGMKSVTLPHLASGKYSIGVGKNGKGTLHYILSYEYRLGATAPGRMSGLRVIRTVHPANSQTVLATIDLSAQTDSLSLAAGNVYDIAIEIAVDHAVDRVVITDPLPAGFEALDASFLTTAAYYQPLAQDWQIDYQQVYRDRITAFAQHLDPGVYTFHYLARSVTPGRFLWPGTSAYLLNAPEQFGRTAFRSVTV